VCSWCGRAYKNGSRHRYFSAVVGEINFHHWFVIQTNDENYFRQRIAIPTVSKKIALLPSLKGQSSQSQHANNLIVYNREILTSPPTLASSHSHLYSVASLRLLATTLLLSPHRSSLPLFDDCVGWRRWGGRAHPWHVGTHASPAGHTALRPIRWWWGGHCDI
jgi:hypothetical protein